jgi:hypothetical protein
MAARVRTDGFVEPCIRPKPPSGPDWVHEIKHDGHRLIVRREGEAVRLFTRRGFDWTDRCPAIAAVAAKLRARSFTVDLLSPAPTVGRARSAPPEPGHRRHPPGTRSARAAVASHDSGLSSNQESAHLMRDGSDADLGIIEAAGNVVAIFSWGRCRDHERDFACSHSNALCNR